MPALAFALAVIGALSPAEWVPVRWNWSDPASLELLQGTPINCLLLKSYTTTLAAKAREKGLITLAVISPDKDAVLESRRAVEAQLSGVVLEGNFPEATAAKVRDALAPAKGTLIQLPARNRMQLDSPDPVIGTYQAVWAGIQVMEDGHAKSGPTGSPWIDTNSGFIRAVRAWRSDKPLWLGNLPPAGTIIPVERYLQAISDAAIVGARWIVALDDDFARRLARGDGGALRDWRRMGTYLQYFEDHRSWREMPVYAKLAVVQDPDGAALLSGGILDMIGAKHTPVRAIPRQHLTAEALRGSNMAVNVDAGSLTPEQREVLKAFARSGGTLLTAPPAWKQEQAPQSDQITLEKAELERLNDIWHDVQSMVGRKNLGARLFNVSSMLSNVQASPDGRQVLVQLVNYSSYPVENVTVHVLGKFSRARVFTPEGGEKPAEVYGVEDGTGVDLEKVSVCAAVLLE